MPILTWNEDTNEAEEIAGIGVGASGTTGGVTLESIEGVLWLDGSEPSPAETILWMPKITA